MFPIPEVAPNDQSATSSVILGAAAKKKCVTCAVGQDAIFTLPIGLVTPDKPHNKENQEAAWI